MAMRDLLSWNVSLGRWFGVQVRLHAFFLLFAVIALHLAHGAGMGWFGLAGVGLLLASVLIHDAAHAWVAHRLGGRPTVLCLWPFGGLISVPTPAEPAHELAVAMAGPLANLLVCCVAAPVLWSQGDAIAQAFHPLVVPVPETLTWVGAVRLAAWINWMLFLINLLPAFPLDGARALRALLWPQLGLRTSVVLVGRVAWVTALALLIAAWTLHGAYAYASLPLALLGIFLFFSARQEAERLPETVPNDAWQPPVGVAAASAAEPRRDAGGDHLSPLGKWFQQRRAAHADRQRQAAEDDERRIDAVLAKLHATGMESLSSDERAVLDRVSQRYRERKRT